jgi:hypothetical protein
MTKQSICFSLLLIMALQQSSALVLTSRPPYPKAPPARNLLSFATTAKKQREYEKLMCELISPEEIEYLHE